MDDSSEKKTIHSIQCQKWFDSIRFRSLQPSDWSVTELTSVVNMHTRLMALFPGLPGWASTRKEKPIWILLKQETVSGSGISWAICKSAHRSRQITTPAPHHSFFTGQMPFLPPNQQRQSTEGKRLQTLSHNLAMAVTIWWVCEKVQTKPMEKL